MEDWAWNWWKRGIERGSLLLSLVLPFNEQTGKCLQNVSLAIFCAFFPLLASCRVVLSHLVAIYSISFHLFDVKGKRFTLYCGISRLSTLNRCFCCISAFLTNNRREIRKRRGRNKIPHLDYELSRENKPLWIDLDSKVKTFPSKPL